MRFSRILVTGLVVGLALFVGLMSGPAGFGPEPQSAEAAVLDEVKKLLASDAQADDDFGFSVAVSGDTAVVGAQLEDTGGAGAGAVYVFGRDQGGPSNWGEVKKLTASDAQSGDQFGVSVAVSGDTVVVGAEREDAGGAGAGAAYVFGRDEGGAGNWGEVKKLTASDAQINDNFGISVAVSGDTVVVGAEREDAGGNGAGAAYVFGRDEGSPGNWGEVKKLTASDAQAYDYFGISVAVDGDTAVVGAWGEDAGGSAAGAAYVFRRDEDSPGNWGEVKKLLASDAQAGDGFGWSVALSGDTAVVGAPFEDAGGATAGAAYVFERDEGGADNWGEVKKLLASDAQADDNFGRSVAVSGDTAVVGAVLEDAGASNAGAAYVFGRDQGSPGNWGEVKKLLASDAEISDWFGWSVAVSGDTAVVGARDEDAGGSNAGAAYVFGPTISAGHDLLETDSSTSFLDFGTPSVPAIPADFFGPGSDPFDGTVSLQGVPIVTFGGFGDLGPTDTIVERLQDAGSTYPDTIDIEIVALSLESTAPITVTYNGGQNPEAWDLTVQVPEGDLNQSTGTMTIRHEYPDGGTFDSTLPVKPTLAFTRQSDLQTGVLDWTAEGWAAIVYQATAVPWCHTANPLTSPAGHEVVEVLGLTTDFFPSITCQPDPDVRVKQFYTSQDGSDARHDLRSAEGFLHPVASAGHDLLETDSSASFMDFGTPSVPAIPADFFGPGSDPFDSTVSLQGVPIVTFGGFGDLGPTDTIVERLQDAGPIYPDTIDIEIVALSLESTAPITITYNGGQDPEAWDLTVQVPEGDLNQSTGTMTISHEYPNGGTFDSTLPVKPILAFARQSDGQTGVLDWTLEGYSAIVYQASAVPWCHTANPLTSPAGHEVVEVLGLTTNFFPSITCQPDPDVRVKQFYTSQDGADARHDLRSAEGFLHPVADAGHDLLETDSSASFLDFGTTSVPAIPADFFGPGSDPFDYKVFLQGVPIDTFGAFTGLSPTDTIVERLEDAGPIYPDTIDIEIVALSLESTAPITVTYNGGQDPETWDLEVEVPANGAQSTGTMTISHEYPDGGTFNSMLPVKPRLVFTRISDLQTTELDWTVEGLPAIEYEANDVPWCHTANPLTSPAGGVVIEKVGLTTNFFPSITCQPDPDVRVKQFYTSQDGSDAQHTLRSAETTDVCPSDPNDDIDGDGICVGNGFYPPKTGDNDNCPTTPNPGQENADGDPYGDACETVDCVNQFTPWVTPSGDVDCDGSVTGDVNSGETFFGTDPADPCSDTPTMYDERGSGFGEPEPAWAFDINDDQLADFGDILAFAPHFNKTFPDPAYSARFDFYIDQTVDFGDVLQYVAYFNMDCTDYFAP